MPRSRRRIDVVVIVEWSKGGDWEDLRGMGLFDYYIDGGGIFKAKPWSCYR